MKGVGDLLKDKNKYLKVKKTTRMKGETKYESDRSWQRNSRNISIIFDSFMTKTKNKKQ